MDTQPPSPHALRIVDLLEELNAAMKELGRLRDAKWILFEDFKRTGKKPAAMTRISNCRTKNGRQSTGPSTSSCWSIIRTITT